MSANITYLVEIELATKGSLVNAGVEEAAGKVAGLDRNMGGLSAATKDLASSYLDFGRSIGNAFMGVMDKVVDLGMGLATLGATTAFGGLMYGAFSLNNELEKTTMSIASILQAAGQVPDIGTGLEKSASIMTSMRKDAAALPGEFQDLIGIFRTIATPGFNLGMTEQSLEKFSSRAMAAGAVMGLRSDMVGRELSQALEGRVGGHNVFATRLGITGAEAEKFRGLKPEERVAALEKQLTKYDGAVQAFGASFEAQSSTAIDNMKLFGVEASKPLFEKAKVALTEINGWFDNNQGTVTHYANAVGELIRDGFDKGRLVLLEYGPAFITFTENAYDRLKGIFIEAKPYLEAFGEKMKEILSDPGTIDKIITALKLYAAIKVGGALLSVGGPVGGIAKAGFAFAGAGGGIGSGLGGVGGALGGMAGAEGGLAALLPGLAGAASALFILAAAAAAAYAGYRVYNEYTDAVKEATVIQTNNTNAMVDNLAKWSKDGEIDTAGEAFKDALQQMTDASGEAAAALFSLATEAHNDYERIKKRTQKDTLDDVNAGTMATFGMYAQAFAATGVTAIKKAEEPKKKGPPAGGSHTNVYVSMTISSNQAPGQIARRAAGEIARLSSNRRSSGYAPDFTARTR